jgi:hypothetical protein
MGHSLRAYSERATPMPLGTRGTHSIPLGPRLLLGTSSTSSSSIARAIICISCIISRFPLACIGCARKYKASAVEGGIVSGGRGTRTGLMGLRCLISGGARGIAQRNGRVLCKVAQIAGLSLNLLHVANAIGGSSVLRAGGAGVRSATAVRGFMRDG